LLGAMRRWRREVFVKKQHLFTAGGGKVTIVGMAVDASKGWKCWKCGKPAAVRLGDSMYCHECGGAISTEGGL